MIYQEIDGRENTELAGKYLTKCKACGEWIITKQKRAGYCIDCLISKNPASYYKSFQWKQLKELIFKEKGNICAYCLQPATKLCHIIPLGKGGVNVFDNLDPICDKCSYKKLGYQ